jgi:hypothetical protein
MVTRAVPSPDASPLQPTKAEPELGAAVKVTGVPLSMYVSPGGDAATVPVPVPVFVTLNVK